MEETTRNKIKEARYIICSCEGAAEQEIMELLLDNEETIFDRSQLVFGEVTKLRKGEDIKNKYLGADYDEKIILIRILDSKREKIRIPKPYNEKVEIVNINTNPEIEILIIIYFEKYQDYIRHYKSSKKPSEYCKEILKIPNCKKQGYFSNLFGNNIDVLVKVIKEYSSYRNRNEGYFLSDLLK